jgi:DNA polymerase-1
MITPTMRQQAKTVNFGILYGQTPFGLAKGLSISVQEATAFIHAYFQKYPRVQEFLEDCKTKTRKTRIAKTLIGRQRPIEEISNKNPAIRAAAERLAINTPLQGSAADLIKLAMIAIHREIESQHLQGKMILQIHDELLFEVPDEELPLFQTLIQTHMEGVVSLKVPLKVEIAIGKNWAEC